MSNTMTLNVRVSGSLREHVVDNVGEFGLYENVSEYVRDLIRRDRTRVEGERFEALKAELQRAFASPEENYRLVSAADVIARNKARRQA